VGGGAGCADFWRISAVFWFHAGIRSPATGKRGQRIKAHVSRPAHPVPGITASDWRG